MEEIGALALEALKSLYNRKLMVFAIATSLIALFICLLDWIVTKLLGRSSILGVGFGGVKTLQAILLWGVGAGVGAYVGGLIELFNIESVSSKVIVGVSWPTILPRLIAISTVKEKEEEQEESQEESN